MKRVAIFLRKDQTNKFRRIIINTLKSSQINNAILCSGFFQHQPAYQAGVDFSVISHRNKTPLKIKVVGIYTYTWKEQYENFFHTMNTVNRCPAHKKGCNCFKSERYIIPSMKWHAKIFIAKMDDAPLIAVIGSSNITSKAFGEFKSFNRECDVVFWDEGNIEINRIIENVIGDVADFSDVIVTNYDESHRANITPLQQRLIRLESEIFARAKII